MEMNIGNDTLIRDKLGNPVIYPVDLDALVNKTQDMSFAYENNYSVAASGVCFTKEKEGILSRLCNRFYSNRKDTKKKMLQIKNEHEKIVEELRKRGVEV